MLLLNFQNLKKPKKISSQQFSVKIIGKQKNPNERVVQKPIVKEEKLEPVASRQVNQVDKKEGAIEKKSAKAPSKEEVKAETKKVIEVTKSKVKKESTKPEVKKVEEKIEKKDSRPEEKKPKKGERSDEQKKKPQQKPKVTTEENKAQVDVFAQSLGEISDNATSFTAKIANLVDDDLAIIKNQVSRNWIKSACIGAENTEIVLEMRINNNCDIIATNIDMAKYIQSQETLACANSALRAAQQIEKLELKTEKCKEIGSELIVLRFNP